ncbi:MAG: epoxyqueuosine reductase QueH [Eubacteriales bacterium]|jgi:predicted adenine nucleotide alpha hydrolase (AANH) superfamily ATPase
MNTRNYQKELDAVIERLEKTGEAPRLLLHSCCAPCSSYVLEYLSKYFSITDFYYNPNITEREEYRKRVGEMERLIRSQPHIHEVTFVEGEYDPAAFLTAVKGLEDCPEGGDRCSVCFRMRLRETAQLAARWNMEYVTTTLTISPLKNAELLNQIGEEEAELAGVKWLPSDFKKRGGYQRSIELSREYDLYRQNYCGCVFSRRRDLKLSLEK